MGFILSTKGTDTGSGNSAHAAPQTDHHPAPTTHWRSVPPTVQVKDEVQLGEIIGNSEAFVSSPVHTSMSGVVKKVEPYPHPGGTMVNSVIIEANETDQSLPPKKEQRDAASYSVEEIRTAVRNAGLVGLGGAGFPTHVKLTPPKISPLIRW